MPQECVSYEMEVKQLVSGVFLQVLALIRHSFNRSLSDNALIVGSSHYIYPTEVDEVVGTLEQCHSK